MSIERNEMVGYDVQDRCLGAGVHDAETVTSLAERRMSTDADREIRSTYLKATEVGKSP